MNETEIKWNDYKMNVELFSSYLELSIKLNMFYYAITGAILSFYFTNTEAADTAKYALYLPILLSFGLSVFFIWGARSALILREHIVITAKELGLKTNPEGLVLVLVCLIFGISLGLVSLALFYYVVFF